MATPGQFVEQAMLGGYREGSNLSDSRKQAEWAQNFQDKHNEIQSQIDNLANRASLIHDKNSPEYLKIQDDLANHLQARDQLWGGEHHHPHFVELAKQLGRDLHFPVKPKAAPVVAPTYGQTPAMNLGGTVLPAGEAYKVQGPQTPEQIKAQQEASAILNAGPLTPEEQVRQKSRQTLAAIQGALKNYETVNPDATPEEKQGFLNDIIQKVYGTTLSDSWVEVPGTIHGKPITLKMGRKTGRMEYQDGQIVPPEDLSTFVPTEKTTAAQDKHAQYLQARKDGYQRSEPQWLAEQAARGRANVPSTNLETRHVQIQAKAMQGIPLTPEETAFEKSYQADLAQKQEFQTKLAQLREAGYGLARQMGPIAVLDTWNNNSPTEASFLDMKKQPGRYIPATAGGKALSQENLIHDMVDTSGKLRTAIDDMRTDFPEDMKAKIAVAMGAQNPGSALSMLISSGSLGALNPDQFQVYVYLQQLAENSMSLRSVLGAGQGSDAVRNAILNTLPSLLSPNKKYALMQLDAYDATVARLARGVPKVGLRTDIPGTPNYIPQGSSEEKTPHIPVYKYTASGKNGEKIGSNDGENWFYIVTGKKVQ